MKRRTAGSLPPTSQIRRHDTHRLIPSRYSSPADPLQELADTATQFHHLVDLSNATDEAGLTESGLLPAISPRELASGPHAYIINAAFIYAHPAGSRFNGADRGAWYGAFQLITAQAEVAFHKTVHLAEVGRFEDEVEFDDYLADFSGEFHDLRRVPRFTSCLDPKSYVASQGLAEKLLENGSLGVIYPSVRRPRGTCIACFDPKSVRNVRKAQRFRFTWHGRPTPQILPIRARRPRLSAP